MLDKILQFFQDEFPEGHYNKDKGNYVCRCRVCGDSIKNKSHMHFYITIKENTPIMYHCFRCGVGGVMSYNMLRSMSNINASLGIIINKYNTRTLVWTNKLFPNKHTIQRLTYDHIQDTEFNQVKLKYISDRLGIKVGYDYCIANRIVLDLKELLYYNRMEPTIFGQAWDDLCNYFIGFLSINNVLCDMRNLWEGHVNKFVDKRYYKYNIYKDVDNTKRFYMIPTHVDLNADIIRLNIAEGAFDINSIFINLRNSNRINELYVAAGSKTYLAVIKLFMQVYGILNLEVHVYFDKDAVYLQSDIQNMLSELGIGFYVHLNQYPGEKDFGVPIEKIKEEVYCLSKEIVF